MKNANYGGPEEMEVDYIPKEGADRESMIKHLKTELMSGSGPDLFIVDAFDGNFYNEKPMFPIPEQMIERRVFLPLDEYIEKAQFAQWDRLTPKVMEAGRRGASAGPAAICGTTRPISLPSLPTIRRRSCCSPRRSCWKQWSSS